MQMVEVLRDSEALPGTVTVDAVLAPDLLRGVTPDPLAIHKTDILPPCLEDDPGTLSDGQDYFYRLDEYGGPTKTLTVDKAPGNDAVSVCFQ